MMTCLKCQHGTAKRFGTYGPQKIQRYRCRECNATFSEPRQKPLGNHYTDVATATRAIDLLTEGMSVRAVSRLTGLNKGTILALLLTIGEKCQRLADARIRNVRPTYVQADELWSFIGKKQKRVRFDDPAEYGDTYIWVALDSETKAILSFYVGKRNSESASVLMRDLSERVTGRFQLTTDAFDAYPGAVEEYFGTDVDYGQLVKVYTKGRTNGPDWYRPSMVVTAIPTPLRGNPDVTRISTSHVERMNLTLRMHCRRFTRLTNAFSKSLRHLRAAVALFMAFYNFCKPHQTLRVTPAMEAGLTDHVWSVRELLTA